MNVLLCDVKSHTALHECIDIWCKVSHHPSLSKVSQFYLSVTQKIASQLPLMSMEQIRRCNMKRFHDASKNIRDVAPRASWAPSPCMGFPRHLVLAQVGQHLTRAEHLRHKGCEWVKSGVLPGSISCCSHSSHPWSSGSQKPQTRGWSVAGISTRAARDWSHIPWIPFEIGCRFAISSYPPDLQWL